MQHRKPTAAKIPPKLSAIGFSAGLAAAVVLMAAANAPAQEAVPEDYGMVRIGESLFRAYCTSCHGPEADGQGPLAETLRVPPANLTLVTQKNGGEFPFDEVVKKIDGTEKVRGHGSSDMPVWGQVFTRVEDEADEENAHDKVVALAHYIRSIQAATEAPGRP